MEKVPGDVLRRMTENLSGPEIIRLCRVNKRFYQALCDNEPFWKFLYRRDLSDAKDQAGHYLRRKKDYKKAYQNAFADLPIDQQEKNAYAARNGYEKLLVPPFTEGVVGLNAAEFGHLDIVKLDIPKARLEQALQLAAKNGHMGVVDYLLSTEKDRKHASLNAVLTGLAQGSRKELHPFLKAHENELKKASGSILRGAAAGNDVALMRELLEDGTALGIRLPPASHVDYLSAAYIAIGSGSLEALRYLLTKFELSPRSLRDALSVGAEHGQLDMVRYLHESLGAKVGQRAVLEAANGGSVPVFDYLYPRYDSSADEGMKTRAKPLLDAALDEAAAAGRMEMIDHLLEIGGRVSERTADNAITRDGRPDVIMAVVRELRPRNARTFYPVFVALKQTGAYELFPEVARLLSRDAVSKIASEAERKEEHRVANELWGYLETANEEESEEEESEEEESEEEESEEEE